MAEDKGEPREVSLSQRLPWIAIFQGFRIALDFNKLLLAAAGIITMAFGWWLLAAIFSYKEVEFDVAKYTQRVSHLDPEKRPQAMWAEYRKDYEQWALLYRAAGDPDEKLRFTAADFARDRDEYDALKRLEKGAPPAEELAKPDNKALLDRLNDPEFVRKLARMKLLRPAGNMRIWPTSEDRGTNPYLLATGQSGGWEKGGFFDWLLHDQVNVLLEPLVKMIRPIVYFFHPNAGAYNCFYFLLVLFWTVVTWAIFGGAITRIAAVQIARREKITLGEAVRFTVRRWVSFVTAPLFPLLFVGFLLIFMVLFGFVTMLPWVGDVFSGLLWWVMLIFGVLMAVGLIGLIGWPLMSATISTEGTDSWEAVSRSYSYVFQAPWYYLWCSLVTLFYGAVVVFFVGFVGSFAVYLSKWGVSQTPWIRTADREPSFLFVYTPTSFGWRDLMLKDATVDGTPVVNPGTGRVDPIAYERYLGATDAEGKRSKDALTWFNKVGAVLVGIWVYFFFLLILGFGYSFFWSGSTIVYFLMRKRVDDAEMDEVYLEEDDADSYQGSLTSPPAAPPAPPAAPMTGPAVRVEAPTLRQPTPPVAPPLPTSAPPPPIVPAPPPPIVSAPPPEPPAPHREPPHDLPGEPRSEPPTPFVSAPPPEPPAPHREPPHDLPGEPRSEPPTP